MQGELARAREDPAARLTLGTPGQVMPHGAVSVLARRMSAPCLLARKTNSTKETPMLGLLIRQSRGRSSAAPNCPDRSVEGHLDPQQKDLQLGRLADKSLKPTRCPQHDISPRTPFLQRVGKRGCLPKTSVEPGQGCTLRRQETRICPGNSPQLVRP